MLVAELGCGVLLSFVFIMSHNGMEVYDDGRNFLLAQMASTRNIDGSLFNDWHACPSRTAEGRGCASTADSEGLLAAPARFTGGLNRQIEHHLFPTLPRHNLGKVRVLAPFLQTSSSFSVLAQRAHFGVAPFCTGGQVGPRAVLQARRLLRGKPAARKAPLTRLYLLVRVWSVSVVEPSWLCLECMRGRAQLVAPPPAGMRT